MASVPTAANAGYYAEIVRERAILRRLVEAGTRIVQMGYAADGGEVDEVVDRAQAEVYDVTERRTTRGLPAARRDHARAPSTRSRRSPAAAGRMVGVPTGFDDLDQLTNGLHPGQMIVVAARPAVGKSTLALDFARSASHQARPDRRSIFSLEMSRNEITMRLLVGRGQGGAAPHARPARWATTTGTQLARTMGEVAEAPLFIDDSPNMSMMEIRAKCRRLKQRHDLKLVVIDYLQLMTSGKRVESRQQEVVGVLPLAQAARQGARGPGDRDQPAEPWPRAAHRQEADAVRPA